MRNLLSGKSVILTAIKDSDLNLIEDWFNNSEFLRFYDFLPAVPKTLGEVKRLVDTFSTACDKYIFAIRVKESNRIIGITGFDDIVWSNGVATVFIGIGDREYTFKGFGKEILQLLLDFGFNELNFYRIQLNVISYNKPAIKLYEGLGFKREGTYREFILRDEKRFDLYLYGLLKDEWKEQYNQSYSSKEILR